MFDTISKPEDLMRFIASGDGASIQSTWPASRAAVRADGSGIGIRVSLSSFGTRLLSQCSLFGTSSASSRALSAVSFHGPVPAGFFANSSQLLPAASQPFGEANTM